MITEEGNSFNDWAESLGSNVRYTEEEAATPEATVEEPEAAEPEQEVETPEAETDQPEVSEEQETAETPEEPEASDPETPTFDWSTLGETFTSEEDVRNALGQTTELQNQIKELQGKLEQKTEFNSPVIELANKLAKEYGESAALSMAQRLTQYQFSESNPIEALVQKEIIDNPEYAAHESQIREELQDKYRELEDGTLEKTKMVVEAKKAANAIKEMRDNLGYQDPKAAIERKNALVAQAETLRPQLANELKSVTIGGVKLDVPNVNQYVSNAISWLVNSGDVSQKSVEEVVGLSLNMAKAKLIDSPEYQQKIEEAVEARLNEKRLKERSNPSTTEKAATQKPVEPNTENQQWAEIWKQMGLRN